jgi:cysteine desulfurase family protein (TIGR01976 family)
MTKELSHNAQLDLDLNFIRKLYPAARWQRPFFENAGGAFVPQSVISRMTDYMTEAQVQTGYSFTESVDATERVSRSQTLMSEIIGAEREEVILGPSTSINVYVLAQALRPLFKPGDEIIVSTLNHESNSGPWRKLAEFGVRIVEWPADSDTGAMRIDDLDSLLNERTRLVAFPQVSNITGDINDVGIITNKVHAVGAMVCVDGVAFAPHRPIDVKAWDVDFYLFSFYKVFGPHLGLLYCRKDRLLAAKGQYHYFFPEDDLDHKLNPAGPNHETIASLTGISEYLDTVHRHHFANTSGNRFERTQELFQLFAEHEQKLAQRFLEFINAQPSIRLVGSNSANIDTRVPTFSLQIKGIASKEVAQALAKEGIACGSGHFYAKRLLDSLNILEPEVLRCSMAHYTSMTDVEQLIDCLKRQIPC